MSISTQKPTAFFPRHVSNVNLLVRKFYRGLSGATTASSIDKNITSVAL
ncbi:MAG: hypothetical protein LBI34_03560 [Puniceicoccales bacterium]|nr:hypothetical protein [Puniceicoccales bacterium]